MLQASFHGSSYVGVFARATDEYLFVRPDLDETLVDDLAAELSVSVVETTIGGAATVGSLLAGNENGLIASNRITEAELDRIREAVSVPVAEVPGTITAVGNVVLANSNAAYVHPDLSEEAIKTIADTLAVPVDRGMIAEIRTVGMAAAVTDNGLLCHPKTTDEELDWLSKHFDVYADIGTINYGGPLVGSGLIANDAGYVAGEDTTGPELGRIEDALGYLD